MLKSPAGKIKTNTMSVIWLFFLSAIFLLLLQEVTSGNSFTQKKTQVTRVKQQGQANTLFSCLHADSKVEFFWKSFPRKEFYKSSGLNDLKKPTGVCLKCSFPVWLIVLFFTNLAFLRDNWTSTCYSLVFAIGGLFFLWPHLGLYLSAVNRNTAVTTHDDSFAG